MNEDDANVIRPDEPDAEVEETRVDATPDSAEEAGVAGNPEVPTAVDASEVPSSPWARPSGGEGTTGESVWAAATYTPPPAWDVSGYTPPAALKLDEIAGSAEVAAQAIDVQAVSTTAVAARPVREEPVRGRGRPIHLRPSLTILLFLAGVTLGVLSFRQAAPAVTARADPFPALDRTKVEPIPAGAVATELQRNDVHGLAQLLDGDTLTAIQTQLKPLVSFESVTFVGATSLDHDTLAGYIVRGRDQDGTLGLVGLVIRLRDGQVVAQ